MMALFAIVVALLRFVIAVLVCPVILVAFAVSAAADLVAFSLLWVVRPKGDT